MHIQQLFTAKLLIRSYIQTRLCVSDKDIRSRLNVPETRNGRRGGGEARDEDSRVSPLLRRDKESLI